MERLSNILGKAIAACLFLALCVLVAVTFWQVLCRFIIKIPVAWSEEIARMSFVWLIFLGSAIAVKEGSHLMLDMLTSAVRPNFRRAMEYWVLLAILAVSGVIFYAGGSYCLRSLGKTAVTLPIPSNCVYAAVPVSAALMAFFAAERLLRKISGGKEGGK